MVTSSPAEARPTLRARLRALIHSRWMPVGAGLLGFLEGSFIPFPIEPLAIPAMATRFRNAFLIAACLLAGNVIGALMMYGLGSLLAEPVLMPMIDHFGAAEAYRSAVSRLREHGFIALFLVGITPFPFQIGTAAAGAVGYSLPLFIFAVSASRGLRYLALALIVLALGKRTTAFIDRYQAEIIVGGFAVFALVILITVLA